MNLPEYESLTAGEKSLVKWQINLASGFEETLWICICKADGFNLARLAEGFPSHVEAYRNYAHVEDWWGDLRKRVGV